MTETQRTETSTADAGASGADAGSAATAPSPLADLFDRTLDRMLEADLFPPLEWDELWEREEQRISVARNWELDEIRKMLPVEAEDSGVGLVSVEMLDQIIGPFERGLDGYASRMSREGRDYFAWLLRQLREVRASIAAD